MNIKSPQRLIDAIPEISFLINTLKNSSKLKKNIEKAIKKNDANFFNYLVELNIAAILFDRNKKFLYESLRGIDFVWDDIALSVKSITDKKYRKKEKDIFKKLGNKEKTEVHYPNTIVELRKDEFGGEERIETGTFKYGESPETEMKEKSKILECMAELESICANGLRKVLFVLGQSDMIDSRYIYDCSRWYFRNSINSGDLTSVLEYQAWFKKNKDRFPRQKNYSIEAIVYTEPYVRGIYNLTWYNGADYKCWFKNKEVANELKNLFRPRRFEYKRDSK